MNFKTYVSSLALLFTASCAYEDPHVYFLRGIERSVGTTLHGYEFAKLYKAQSNIQLPNGNIEYRYAGNLGRCIRIYEVNPKTDIIVQASFEGNKKDCVQMP